MFGSIIIFYLQVTYMVRSSLHGLEPLPTFVKTNPDKETY